MALDKKRVFGSVLGFPVIDVDLVLQGTFVVVAEAEWGVPRHLPSIRVGDLVDQRCRVINRVGDRGRRVGWVEITICRVTETSQPLFRKLRNDTE